MNRQNIIRSISSSFPTVWHNATKFGVNPVKSELRNKLFNRVNQILMAITLASISGVSRICRIADFSGDGLVKSLLRLKKGINENAISATLKNLGQGGARKLHMLLLSNQGGLKTKKGGKHENQHESVWVRYVQVAQKQVNKVAFVPNGQRIITIQGWS